MKNRILITATLAVGMAFSAFILPHSTSAKTTIGSAPLFQDNCVVTGTNNVPLRVRATPNGRVIGSLKLGANIKAYGIEQDNNGDDWTKIKYRKGYGFISTQFVSCG